MTTAWGCNGWHAQLKDNDKKLLLHDLIYLKLKHQIAAGSLWQCDVQQSKML